MRYKKIFFYLSLIFILTSINLVSALFDFSVDVDSTPTPTPYGGETVSLEASVTPSVEYGCKLICKWATADFGENSINGGQSIPNGERKDFGYTVEASGFSGNKQFTLEVSCKRSDEGFNCFESSYTTKQFGTYNFNFGYLGDNQCQLKKSNNEPAEDCTKSLNDCPCTSSGAVCINSIGSGQWAGRTPDDKKCVTYCGNGIKESTYESCSSCPTDVGQCSGYVGCVSGNECEGGFCIHEVCWDKPWKEGDGFCDVNEGENCKNSDDCACKNNELCSNTGICEKPETNKEEITEVVKRGVQESLQSSQKKTKNVTLWAIGLIVLFLVGYLIYKFTKNKKAKLEKNIKEHRKHIAELKKKDTKTNKSSKKKK